MNPEKKIHTFYLIKKTLILNKYINKMTELFLKKNKK